MTFSAHARSILSRAGRNPMVRMIHRGYVAEVVGLISSGECGCP
jgi:hypothetical protein